jgi:hypothetical protein
MRSTLMTAPAAPALPTAVRSAGLEAVQAVPIANVTEYRQ